MPDARATQPRQSVRAAVVGVSESSTCGMRDHAVLLSEALAHEDIACTSHWLWRSEPSLRGARAEFRSWRRGLATELHDSRRNAIILHYSVFSYSYRGFPLFVGSTMSALRRSGVPVVGVLHEFRYPWHMGGLRGKAWALSQSAVLPAVMRTCGAAVVTEPLRGEWLAAQRWLPRRTVELAPVFSNLPAPSAGQRRPDRGGQLIGLFGYAYQGAALSLVLDALRLLHDRGPHVRLALLGAPGPDAPAADAWREGARARGIEHALSFSGVLPAQSLSDALHACDVLLHPEPSGPTSRKGSLAGSLASGAPVVALDGPRAWPELIRAQAALIAAPRPEALADALAGLLADESRRDELGARGSEFARGAMGVERTARVVAGLVEELLDNRPLAVEGALPAVAQRAESSG